MKRVEDKQRRRAVRKRRVRARINGSPERPRLTVFKSNRHLYAQAIDDRTGVTIASVSSLAGDTKGLKPTVGDGERLGEAIGKELQAKKISEAVFDRNGYLYHGVVRAIAEGARKSGLKL